MAFPTPHHEDDIEIHGAPLHLYPFTVTYPLRKLSPPIRLNGHTIHQRRPAKVVEWVNTQTGEIIEQGTFAKQFGKPSHRSERALQRDFVLQHLRPEARALARYILKFRNLRRGVSPPLPTLLKWYADLHGQRVTNVRRMVPTLKAAGIVLSDTLIGPLWQRSSLRAPSSSFLQEECRAAVANAVIRMERLATTSLEDQTAHWQQRARPAWLSAVPSPLTTTEYT